MWALANTHNLILLLYNLIKITNLELKVFNYSFSIGKPKTTHVKFTVRVCVDVDYIIVKRSRLEYF